MDDLKDLMGNEYEHVVNHFKNQNEQLTGITIFNTANPQTILRFQTNAQVWDYIKKQHNSANIVQFRDPAEPDRIIIRYGDPENAYVYKEQWR